MEGLTPPAVGGGHRDHTVGEEIANSITHGLGIIASIVGLPILVLAAATRGDPWRVVGVAVFSAALILLYTASTVYHALPVSRAKLVFRIIDHSAIYLLIAGTYTPFALGAMRGVWGWTLLGLVWACAAGGVAFKTVLRFQFPRMSTILYLAMGWIALAFARPFIAAVPPAGLAWILVGGLFYTGGIAFFLWERQRYTHALWHLCVLGGSVCHFLAVLWYST